MKLDKQQTRAIIIIGVILILYMIYNELQKYDSKNKAQTISKFL